MAGLSTPNPTAQNHRSRLPPLKGKVRGWEFRGEDAEETTKIGKLRQDVAELTWTSDPGTSCYQNI
jgi:hypothetical protein